VSARLKVTAPKDSDSLKDDSETCTICLEDLEDKEEAARLDCCSHRFHSTCILAWAKRSSSCPACRKEVKEIFDPKVGLREKVSKKKFAAFGVATNTDLSDYQEQAIADRRAARARCYVCGMGDRDESLLLCDGMDQQCPRSGHYDCLGLPSLPSANEPWFCDICDISRTSLSFPLPVQSPDNSEISSGRRPSTPTSTATPASYQRLVESLTLQRQHNSSGQSPAPGCGFTVVELAQRMQDALDLDKVQGSGSVESRKSRLPEVIRHMNIWRRLLEYASFQKPDLLKVLGAWLSPTKSFENSEDAERLRFALLQQLQHIAPLLTFTQARASKIGVSIMRCFQNENESERNKILQQNLISIFQRLVDSAFEASRSASVSNEMRETVRARSALRQGTASPSVMVGAPRQRSASFCRSSQVSDALESKESKLSQSLPQNMTMLPDDGRSFETKREIVYGKRSEEPSSPRQPKKAKNTVNEAKPTPPTRPLSFSQRAQRLDEIMRKQFEERLKKMNTSSKLSEVIKEAVKVFKLENKQAVEFALARPDIIRSNLSAEETFSQMLGIPKHEVSDRFDPILRLCTK